MEIGQKKLEMVAMVIIIVIKDFICYGKVPRRKEMLQQCYVMLNGKKNHAHVVMAKERKKERESKDHGQERLLLAERKAL